MPIQEDVSEAISLIAKLKDTTNGLNAVDDLFSSALFKTVITVQDELASSLSSSIPLTNASSTTSASVAAFSAAADNASKERILLKKGDNGYGLLLMGGVKLGFPPFISGIIKGGAAYENGRIKRGDRIVSVNGTLVDTLIHEEVVDLLKSAVDEVDLLVIHDTGSLRTTVLTKGPTGLGLNISGGSEQASPLFVSRVIPDGVAEADGVMRRGDMLLEINGESVASATHESVLKVLQNLSGPITFIVWRSAAGLERLEMGQIEREHAEKETLTYRHIVTLNKGAGGLGMGVGGGTDERNKPITITDIFSDGAAAKSDLEVGDVIAEIDGNVLSGRTHEDAVSILKNCKGIVKIVVERTTENYKEVIIVKDGTGLGFDIQGGSDYDSRIFVSSIRPGGAAEIDGLLKKGDSFIAINSMNVEETSHEETLNLLRSAKGSVKLVVKPDMKGFRKLGRGAEIPISQC